MAVSERAVWTTAYINNLPDSSFLYIEDGGSKDSEGKTTPRSLRHFPVKDANGNVDMPHLRNALSRIPQSSLPQSVKNSCMAKARRMLAGQNESASADMPRDNLVRAVFPAPLELRDTGEDMPTMEVGFAVYDEWTKIDSLFEGRFLERIAPGAFRKTIKENLAGMRALFQHGRDPQIGDKVLGPIRAITDTDAGPVAEVPLLDTSYNRDLIPGLRAGVYGASFRFKVMKEDLVHDAEASDHNPDGLPERTILEAKVMEVGPCTFPAYEGTHAGVRSLTDEFMFGPFAPSAERDEQGEQEPAEGHSDPNEEPAGDGHSDAPSTTEGEEPTHSPDETASRDTPESEDRRANTDDEGAVMDSIEALRARQGEIKSELEEIASEHRGEVLSATNQARWDELEQEWDQLDARVKAEEARQERLQRLAGTDASRESGAGTGTFVTRRPGRDQTPDDPFDLTAYHGRSRDQEHMFRLIGEGARRAIETFHYPHPRADRDAVNAHIEQVLRQDSPDKEIALRILNCGSDLYKRAFWKHVTGQPMTHDETRALAVGSATTGGAAVPIDVDPTLIPTSNGALNPIRQIARVITTTSYLWSGVGSGGITAQYRAEGAAMSDNAPTLTQPQIQPERADVFVPFSWELGEDWASLEANLAVEIQDAKDTLEATKFANGAGHASTEPQGIAVGAGTIIGSVASTAFSVGDLYKLEDNLPARFQPNASWIAAPSMFNKVRQLDTAGGANLWVQLQNPNPPTLIGYPAYKLSTYGTAGSAYTGSAKWGILGDFNYYGIVDRIGMSIRVIDNLFGTSGVSALNVPTGQSGLVAFWRNSAGVLTSNAFRQGTIVTTGI